MPRRGEVATITLPAGPGGANPGGEINPDVMPPAIEKGGRVVKAAWRRSLRKDVWGSVLGRADLPLLEQYCLTAAERALVYATIKDPDSGGEYGHLSRAHQLGLLGKWDSFLLKIRIEFGRRVSLYAGKPGKQKPGPKVPENVIDTDWGTGRVA